ncbi:MAG: ATP-binding cassette domain-containing protein, partial [Bacteroidetes bacterium]|nr:ATP-binding cassette domain-containing protein [Bacteroidota bacterium]
HLKEDKRVIEVIKDIAEYIPVAGGQLSAAQLLERFLFAPEQQYNYVSTLSGGERRRLYLLTILIKNPNFLILDEPTNDLDILTLNVLEEFLLDYKGCLIIVSHDRYFLDKLTDWLFVFEGNGKIKTFLGNYKEYRDDLKEQLRLEKGNQTKIVSNNSKSTNEAPKKKLNFKEQQEFVQLDKDISTLSEEKDTLTAQLSSGAIDHNEIQNISSRLQEIIDLLDEKEMRWLELSEFA